MIEEKITRWVGKVAANRDLPLADKWDHPMWILWREDDRDAMEMIERGTASYDSITYEFRTATP